MRYLALCAGLALALAPATAAQEPGAAAGAVLGTSPEAARWFEKAAALQDKPVEFDLGIAADTPQGKMKGSGHWVTAGATHAKGGLTMEIDAAAMGMDEPLVMEMLMVSDGETLWTEMNSPMTGRQVMKLSLAQARDLQKKQGAQLGLPMMGPQGAGMDFQGSLKQLAEFADFQVESEEGGRVKLVGLLTAKGEQVFAQAGGDADRIVVELDAQTAFPLQMTFGTATSQFMRIGFTSVKFLEKEKLDMGQFRYAPPEGVTVVDLGRVMGLGAGKKPEEF